MDYKDYHTLYQMSRTMTDDEIGRSFGVAGENIYYWRKKYGIPATSKPRKGNRLHTINDALFNTIDTPEKAYILGFIAADGCVHKNLKSLAIAIAEEDVEVLHWIKDALNSNAPIYQKTRNNGRNPGKHLAVLNLCSRRMIGDLVQHGITPNKSFTILYPHLPAHLDSHFIRGVLDGDGYIGPRQFAFTGSEPLMAGIQQVVLDHTGHLLYKRLSNQHPSLVGSRRDHDVLIWIFKGATLRLSRKFQRFVEFWL